MKNVLCVFSGRAYDATTRLIAERAPKMGVDEVLIYDERDLVKSGFRAVNNWLFEAKSQIQNTGIFYQHGHAWCSWKAHILDMTMERFHFGDVIMYLDADCIPLAPFGQLFDECAATGIMLFEEKVSNLRFTRAGCMKVMGLPVADGPHACGRFSLWQKGSFLARQVLNEWWAYSINPECTLWGPSTICADPPEYYRHSTEQSVLSNLAIKYSIPLHRAPDAGGFPVKPGDKDEHLYGQLFEQIWCAGDRSDLSGSSYRNV